MGFWANGTACSPCVFSCRSAYAERVSRVLVDMLEEWGRGKQCPVRPDQAISRRETGANREIRLGVE
jgi:hypothetical protein